LKATGAGLSAYIDDCFGNRVRQDWLFVNVSQSSRHYGKKQRVCGKTFDEALEEYRRGRRYGKVNKVVFTPDRGTRVSCYLSGGVIKRGEPVNPDMVKLYLNDERWPVNPVASSPTS